MRKMRSRYLVAFLSLLVAMLVVWEGQAQSQEKYPTGPIDLICPYSPGGSTDLFSRTLASFLSKKLGVPVNVVNKPGGNAIPGILAVYNARPDGYTMLGDINSSSSMLGAAVKDLPFKIMDRTFVSIVGTAPQLFVVATNSPFKNLKDIAVEAKRDPGNFTWAMHGTGTDTVGFATRQFFKEINVDIRKIRAISVPGAGPAVTLVAGGHAMLGCTTFGGAAAAIKAGTLRGLAVTSKNRHPDWPDIPTTTESGFSNVNITQWYGLSGPPKIPAFIVTKLEKAIEEIVRDPEMIDKLKNIGITVSYLNAQSTREFVIKESDEVSRLWGMIK